MAYYGCVSVAPPVFLSEEEAYAVITQIAQAEGLHFVVRDHSMNQVPVPRTSLYYGGEEREPIRGYTTGDLVLDGYDESTGIGFEFVSSADIKEWAVEERPGSSVDCYDFAETARALQQGIAESADSATVAVFYEPGSDSRDERVQSILDKTKNYYERGRELKELAKEDLREQVRDFIAWLRAEGII